MGHIGSDNRYFTGDPVTLVALAARTASGDSPAVVMGSSHTLRLTLAVTAASGTTPTLTVNVQHSEDGSTWVTHSSFAAATAVSSQRKVVSGLDRFVRCSWSVGGTSPSFTFTVSGEQV